MKIKVVVIAIAQRERRSLEFSPIAPLGSGAAEMARRQRSTEAAGGAPMGRWFRAREGEIGAGVGAVENGGALEEGQVTGCGRFRRGRRRGGSTV
jgi:hypothetical protein